MEKQQTFPHSIGGSPLPPGVQPLPELPPGVQSLPDHYHPGVPPAPPEWRKAHIIESFVARMEPGVPVFSELVDDWFTIGRRRIEANRAAAINHNGPPMVGIAAPLTPELGNRIIQGLRAENSQDPQAPNTNNQDEPSPNDPRYRQYSDWAGAARAVRNNFWGDGDPTENEPGEEHVVFDEVAGHEHSGVTPAKETPATFSGIATAPLTIDTAQKVLEGLRSLDVSKATPETADHQADGSTAQSLAPPTSKEPPTWPLPPETMTAKPTTSSDPRAALEKGIEDTTNALRRYINRLSGDGANEPTSKTSHPASTETSDDGREPHTLSDGTAQHVASRQLGSTVETKTTETAATEPAQPEAPIMPEGSQTPQATEGCSPDSEATQVLSYEKIFEKFRETQANMPGSEAWWNQEPGATPRDALDTAEPEAQGPVDVASEDSGMPPAEQPAIPAPREILAIEPPRERPAEPQPETNHKGEIEDGTIIVGAGDIIPAMTPEATLVDPEGTSNTQGLGLLEATGEQPVVGQEIIEVAGGLAVEARLEGRVLMRGNAGRALVAGAAAAAGAVILRRVLRGRRG